MKNIMKLMLLVGVIGFSACEDPDGLDNWFDKPEADRNMELILPGEELILTEENSGESLTFSWNAINPPTEEYTIRYVFKLGIQGQNYTPALTSGDLTSDVTSFTITKRALNRFLIQDCALAPDVEVELQAKVLAYIEGGTFYYKPTISEKTMMAMGYDIPLQRLYIVGDANPAGSGLESAVEITSHNKNLFYQKIGVLNPNSSFIITTQPDAMYPAFVRNGDSEMVYVTSETEAAQYSQFTTQGAYVSGALGTANTFAVSVDYNDEADVPTGNCYVGRYCTLPVYVVGDAITGGWGTWVALTWDYKNPDEMTLSGDFFDKATTNSEGCFKMHSTQSYNDPSWRPAVANADPRTDNRVVTSYSGDPKWNIPDGAAGSYTLHFKNHEMWISLEAN